MWSGNDFIARVGLGVTVCWAAVLAATGSTDFLLFLAPALLIAVPLFSGRYFGEKLIARLVAEGTPRPRHAPASRAPAPRRPALQPPRGARLVAFSLAKRPPPLAPLTQT